MLGGGGSTAWPLPAKRTTARAIAPRMIPADRTRLPVAATPGADKGSMGPVHRVDPPSDPSRRVPVARTYIPGNRPPSHFASQETALPFGVYATAELGRA